MAKAAQERAIKWWPPATLSTLAALRSVPGRPGITRSTQGTSLGDAGIASSSLLVFEDTRRACTGMPHMQNLPCFATQPRPLRSLSTCGMCCCAIKTKHFRWHQYSRFDEKQGCKSRSQVQKSVAKAFERYPRAGDSSTYPFAGIYGTIRRRSLQESLRQIE